MHKSTVAIIGGGLAGCEAAWQLAKRGIQVNIYEMRGIKDTLPIKVMFWPNLYALTLFALTMPKTRPLVYCTKKCACSIVSF